MVERRQPCGQLGAAGWGLDAKRALPGSRQRRFNGDQRADAVIQAQALEPRGGQDDGAVFAAVKLAEPRVEVAAQRLDHQVRIAGAQQGLAAQAGGADHSAGRHLVERGEAVRNQCVARVFALHHRGQREAGGQFHRHILERMHRQVRAAFVHRELQFFDKQTLAADFRQRTV
ncbi:hypothetical protein D3C81_1278540 [compost metagenome]